MSKMAETLQAWGKESFEQVFKTEIEQLKGGILPLEEVIGEGNTVYDGDLGAILLNSDENEDALQLHAGIYFAEIVSCCSCGEGDPIEEAYCELAVTIDKHSAEANFRVIRD